MSCTTDDVTFGGGTKAAGFTSNSTFTCMRQPTSTLSRPYFFEPGPAAIRSATSRWNISTAESYHGGQGSMLSQCTRSVVATL